MCYLAFVTAIGFYVSMVWAHIYLMLKDPSKFVDVAIAGLHGLGGLALIFFILFRAFYGAALGKPCWLIYKVLEAAFIVISKVISILPYVHFQA